MSIARISKLHEDSDTLFINGIRLPVGGIFKVLDADGFALLEIDEATKKVKIRGNIERI